MMICTQVGRACNAEVFSGLILHLSLMASNMQASSHCVIQPFTCFTFFTIQARLTADLERSRLQAESEHHSAALMAAECKERERAAEIEALNSRIEAQAAEARASEMKSQAAISQLEERLLEDGKVAVDMHKHVVPPSKPTYIHGGISVLV